MSWRVVVISKRSKLDFKMGFLVIRSDDDEKRIHLDDISVLMCETTAISITAYLLAELSARKIKVIFCDNLHNPISELIPMRSNYISAGKIRAQMNWSSEIKARVWQNIVKNKIKNQADALLKADKLGPAAKLQEYATTVEPGDVTNREGIAAKTYFPALFGEEFFRESPDVKNAMLDYGYAILLACFNREIAASGYLTQIGLWHDNASNPFNLGSDLMESFRPIIDYFVFKNDFQVFEKEEKMQIVDILNSKISIDNSEQFLNNAIGVYVRSIFTAIAENDESKILNWYEL